MKTTKEAFELSYELHFKNLREEFISYKMKRHWKDGQLYIFYWGLELEFH